MQKSILPEAMLKQPIVVNYLRSRCGRSEALCVDFSLSEQLRCTVLFVKSLNNIFVFTLPLGCNLLQTYETKVEFGCE